MTNQEIYELIDKEMPFNTAMSFDNVGLLVGEKNTEVKGIIVCLDITEEVIEEAKTLGANLIVSHHPVIFNALKSVSGILYKLISSNMSAICCHTNFDMCESIGVNRAFAKVLGFANIHIKGENEYFQTRLKQTYSTQEFAKYIKSKFPEASLSYSNLEKQIKNVALCSGSGSGTFHELQDDIDAYIIGEFKHDLWLEAREKGIAVFALGHYETEKIAVPFMAKYLKDNVSGVEIFESKEEVNPVCYM